MSSSEAATPNVPPPSLDLHQDLWYATDRIRFALGWATLVAAWLISIGVFFGVGWIYSPSTDWGFTDLYLGTIVFAGTGVYAGLQASRAGRALDRWEARMTPFMFAIKFEMLPFLGGEREKDIWERFVSVYPGLERMARPRGILPWTRRKNRVRYRAAVRGKKGEHFFHVYGRDKDDELFFVRRYEEAKPVTQDDLARLKSDVEDVYRKVGTTSLSVAAFAASGFEPDAIEYAKSEDGLVHGDEPIDLFEETPTGYKVVFVSTD